MYGGGATRMGVVRYGNVFGSRGSIVEIIKKQRANGEVSLTHPDMTRFWITLDQGIELVLMALEKMVGGEIFIPQIPSMRLKDFVQALAPDCKVKIIGVRPGEKIHETLITVEEARRAKRLANHYIILPDTKDWAGHDHYRDNPEVPADFMLSSNTNDRWLTSEELDGLINSV